MNLISSLRVASLAAAALVVGTLAASAAADASRAPVVTGTIVALNPQPLPPIIDDHEYDFEFRG